jgi:hypothetical protein
MRWYETIRLASIEGDESPKSLRSAATGSKMTQEEFLESANRGQIGGGVDTMEFCPDAVLKGKRPLAFCATLEEMAPKAATEYRGHIESGKIGYLEIPESVSGNHGIFFVPGNEAKARTFAEAVRAGNEVLTGLLLGYSPDDVNRYMSQGGGYEEAVKQWAAAEAVLGKGY